MIEHFVITENIARFRRRLLEPLSEAERRVISQLLKEEEQKLSTIQQGRPEGSPKPDGPGVAGDQSGG